MRFIMPIILVGIAIAVFFMLSNPFYSDIKTLRTKVTSYNEALDNSKTLEKERDRLTLEQNSMDPDNLTKLSKLLPENLDNIRLILEIEQIASPFGMTLKDIKYNANETAKTDTTAKTTTSPATTGATGTAGTQTGGKTGQTALKDYGVWELSFSTTGTYSNFLNFTRALESNLRIVDVSSIQFSSSTTSGASGTASSSSVEAYKYDFKIKTYWLKN